MNSILFCIPLKNACLSQFQSFTKQAMEKHKEYQAMLKRYDIYCAKVWHKNINDRDYVFVYHEVGPDFKTKMMGWDASTHPFDQWFRENIMAVYDIENAAGMEEAGQLIDIEVKV